MTSKDVLIKAKQLLIEKGWTKKHYARTADGVPCDLASPHAACFCLAGAIWAAGSDEHIDVARAARELIVFVLDTHAVSRWNDHPDRTKDEVLAVFDQAIEQAS